MPGNNDLVVFEYNGTARSGKGTIVKYLKQAYADSVTIEETGLDYRALTKALLEAGLIHADMAADAMTETVSSLGESELTNLVAKRDSIIDARGIDSLYDELVNKLVANVSRAPEARRAVKASFKKRVEKTRDDKKYSVLLLDGRNLAPVIKDIKGVRLLLRTFVYCTVEEAARRECARAGLELTSPAGQAILANLAHRGRLDAERHHDAVKPDEDALNFWSYKQSGKPVAVEGVKTSRQIYFDTTPFEDYKDSKKAMCQAAEQMFKDALASQ